MQTECSSYEEIDFNRLICELDLQHGDPISASTYREMLEKMGRNLVLFNLIESSLKRVIPFIHPNGSATGDDAFEALRIGLAKETLGGVAKLFVQSISGADLVGARGYLKAVVDRRNALVHNFFDQPQISITEMGGHEAIRWLDDQHLFCRPMSEISLALLVLCAHGMERAKDNDNDSDA